MLDVSQWRAEELVDSLVDVHLLDVAGHGASGQLRYRFHSLLRAYARELTSAQETQADRRAALDRAFGGWLALAEGAARHLPSSTFAQTFAAGTRWRPDEAILKAVISDPCGWFKVERPAVAGAVEQAFSVGSGQLGWALGVRLARIFLIRGYYDDWRHICELMLTGARRAVSGAADGMTARPPTELHRLALRLDEAQQGIRGPWWPGDSPAGHRRHWHSQRSLAPPGQRPSLPTRVGRPPQRRLDDAPARHSAPAAEVVREDRALRAAGTRSPRRFLRSPSGRCAGCVRGASRTGEK
jgi:hypothetical protein